MKLITLGHVIFIALAFTGASCTHQQPNFLGKWKCDTGLSGDYFWKVGSSRITAEYQDEQIEFEYSLDRSHWPYRLNLITPEETHLCIIEFLDVDTFRVAGLDGDSERPSEFSNGIQTLTFNRTQ